MKEIEIKCKGSMTLDLEQLEAFQGNLKDLSKENYNKLRKQILELGFSDPICVWKNGGKYNILNGHQRVRVLTEMKRSEGYKIPRLPVVEIEANTEHEAKKKILALASQYGEITKQGLFEFASINNIDLPSLEGFHFPEISLPAFKAEFFDHTLRENDPNTEWQDMPEFKNEDLSSEYRIIVHMKSKEDLDSFRDLLQQPITEDTRSIWFPEVEKNVFADKEYLTEDEES